MNNSSAKKILISSLLAEAWQRVNGFKWPVFVLLFLINAVLIPVALILFIGSLLIGMITFGFKNAFPSLMPMLQIILFFIFYIPCFLITWYFVAALSLLAIRHALNLPTKITAVLADCLHLLGKISSLGLIYFAVILLIGLLLFLLQHSVHFFVVNLLLILLASYFSIAVTLFSLPLITVKNKTVHDALMFGFAAMNKHWLKIVGSYLLMYGIIFLSAIPLGIGLIWTIPMSWLLNALWFLEAIS